MSKEDSGKPLLISVVGPTAVGKTALSIKIARKLECEIISADSRQFFRELNIGTAKPSSDELSQTQHHFINSHSINEYYSAGAYGRDAEKLLEDLHRSSNVVVAVGGSSLYLKALWEGFDEMPDIDEKMRDELNRQFKSEGLEPLILELKEKDPEYFASVDINNGQRVIRALEVIRTTNQTFSSFRKSESKDLPYENLKIGLHMEREALYERINSRMDKMINAGLFEEAESLVDFEDHNALQTVGYSEIFRFLKGAYDRGEAVRLLKRNSRRYAKRQMTWFNKYEDIHWFKPSQEKEVFELIDRTMNS